MVIDASVFVSLFLPDDAHHETSRRWFTERRGDETPAVAPAVLLPEVAGAIARRTGEPRFGRRAVAAVLALASLRLVAVEEDLAQSAADIAARLSVRGADAVYIATAAALRLPLVTWDAQQGERAARVVRVMRPSNF
jgi:predicted nucleic acid-binding protein